MEFFQHFLDQVEQNHTSISGKDPSRCFKFSVEERIMCSSSRKVKYTRKTDNILSLNIPLSAAVNKGKIFYLMLKSCISSLKLSYFCVLCSEAKYTRSVLQIIFAFFLHIALPDHIVTHKASSRVALFDSP